LRHSEDLSEIPAWFLIRQLVASFLQKTIAISPTIVEKVTHSLTLTQQDMLLTRSVARSLCGNWASSYSIQTRRHEWQSYRSNELAYSLDSLIIMLAQANSVFRPSLAEIRVGKT